MIGGDENSPGLALTLGVTPGNRHGATKIPDVVVPLAADIEANQIAGSHLDVEVVVSSQRRERPRENSVLSRHYPRPEGATVSSGHPAGVLDCAFYLALRDAGLHGAHSGHDGRNGRLRSRAQGR